MLKSRTRSPQLVSAASGRSEARWAISASMIDRRAAMILSRGRLEIGEERDPYLELVVVRQQGGVGVPDHRLKLVMSGVGEPVHVPRWPPRVRLGGYLLDRALLDETPQGGVENVVVDRPPAQDPLDALLDLIAVLRLIGEHPQHQYVKVHAVRLTYDSLTALDRTPSRRAGEIPAVSRPGRAVPVRRTRAAHAPPLRPLRTARRRRPCRRPGAPPPPPRCRPPRPGR